MAAGSAARQAAVAVAAPGALPPSPAPPRDRASRLALEYRAGRVTVLEALHRELWPLLAPALARYRPLPGALPLALETDDLAQQGWVILADLVRRWRPDEGSFAAYARVSFGWELARYVRAQSHARRSTAARVVSVAHDDAAALLAQRSDVDGRAWVGEVALRELLGQMPALERQALLLCLVEGYSEAETARRLGQSRAGMQRLLRRARRAARAWERGEPLPALQPPSEEALLAGLVEALHRGTRARGALPGRAWTCAAVGLSQVRYAALMRRLVAAGCLVERSERHPGRLADPTPAATLRRVGASAPPAP